MKKMKKILALILAAVCCLSMLAACGSGDAAADNDSAEAAYRVSVVDALGNPYTEGVVVYFTAESGEESMQIVNAEGVAEKVLPRGNYTVRVVFTSADLDCHYDDSNLTLTADKTELEVVAAYGVSGDSVVLYAQDKENAAWQLREGCTYVSLTAGERNYYLFAPSVAGTYEFTVQGDVEAIGYYGASYFVQEYSVVDVVDNRFTVSVNAGMIGSEGSGVVLVIGVDPGSAEGCVLTVERIGDPEYSITDEPWTVYQTTAKLEQYTIPAGATLVNIDITASTDTYTLVYNENDGFYHLDSADGPLVLVNMTENSQYLDSFKTILDNTAMRSYFFDENGEFLKKEEYTDCMLEYLNYVDEDYGVYPLTQDLAYIIQQHGGYAGWYDKDSNGYLFVDTNNNPLSGINADISWLFACCYISE